MAKRCRHLRRGICPFINYLDTCSGTALLNFVACCCMLLCVLDVVVDICMLYAIVCK